MGHGTHEDKVKLVWRVCGVLAIVTAVEIGMALCHFYFLSDERQAATKLLLNLFFIGLSAAKAYYIMSEFMHLKYELKALTLSVTAPFVFLIWAIIAFSYEGGYWLKLQEIIPV